MEIVAMQEMAHGNESIGTVWIETKVFCRHNTMADIFEWQAELSRRKGTLGRLMLSIAHQEINQ